MQVVCVGICSFHVSGGCAAFRRTPTFSPKAERSARPVTQSKSRSKDAYSLLTIRQSPAPRSVCARASSSGDPTAEVASQPEQQAAEADAINQEQAWQLLQEFTRLNARGLDQSMLDSHAKRARLRAATLVAAGSAWPAASWDPAAQPPTILLGIVSSDVRLAMRALRDYLAALHLPFVPPTSRVVGTESAAAVRGACYVKYTAATGCCYVSQYSGKDRGVLLQLGQQQVGHLPLGLFDPDAAAQARVQG